MRYLSNLIKQGTDILFFTDCPHCGHVNSDFHWYGCRQITAVKHNGNYMVFFTCGSCSMGICAVVSWILGSNDINEFNKVVINNRINPMLVSAIYPANDKSIPQDTPDNVRHYFHQALLNMRANPSTYDAAVAMFRTSLEVACRDELGAKGKRLVDMIDDLASSGKITSDMKEWAHALRLGGNVPAHGEKPVTAQEAEDLQKFCEAFMMYAFTLPAMVASRKAQTP